MKIEDLYQAFLSCSSITTDTRKIHENSFFFALKGIHFDANTFAQEALDKGAKFVVIDNKKYFTDKHKMFLVTDVLKTLQELANYHRQQIGLPIIALTGSNGKTTSKELIHTVLSKKYKVTATMGNLNNHIGVPLTLLSIREDDDLAIIEMGANHQKEIQTLCEIAEPDYGYITNFGSAHLEGFGGFEGVVKGKSELYDYLRTHQKNVFVNADDALQVKHSKDIHQISFAVNSSADFVFSETEAQPMASVFFKGVKIQSQLTGLYNIPNICASIAIGTYFNVSLDEVKDAIEQYTPENNRSQWVQKGTHSVLLDAYNANPSSMSAAIANFATLQSDKEKWMILGDMFELGRESLEQHKRIIDLVKQTHIKTIFVGASFFEHHSESQDISYVKEVDELQKQLSKWVSENKLILIKGSRGMALERLLNHL